MPITRQLTASTRHRPSPADRTGALLPPPGWPLEAADFQTGATCDAAAKSRAFIRRRLQRWRLPSDVTEAGCLIVSELTTNALLHSMGDQITVRIRVVARGVFIEVGDNGMWRPPERRAVEDDLAEFGRGLSLVDACAVAHGHQKTARGTRAWAVLAC
ncbi:ATP-binding protein [Streptomyces sp. NPDC005496]|uniref:ATP-binding protein n=1 Tax=unclassified Streptomyces TaxID=2593676 RepID=UPI0033BB57C3